MQKGHLTSRRYVITASYVIPDDTKIIKGDMSEVRAPGAIPKGPHALRCSLQSLIDLHKSALGRFHTGQFQADVGGVGRTALRRRGGEFLPTSSQRHRG